MKLQDKINGAIGKVVNRFTSLSQAENAGAQIEKTVTDGMPELLRQGAAEGAVLLKNNNILPLKKGTKVALFGRTSRDYFFVGYGSGGCKPSIHCQCGRGNIQLRRLDIRRRTRKHIHRMAQC